MKKDGFLFKAYPYIGYQAKIKTKAGVISIRCNAPGLFADKERPYEVWYPTDSEPTGYQTAKDIHDYIRSVK